MKIFKKMKKGFTLVELVVVIAVIAILAAVSVGAYFGVTESANRSKLEQEGKQVQTAIQTISLAGNEHSSLTSNGLEISNVRKFEAALEESLGKEVALTDELDTKDATKPTIYFTDVEIQSALGDKTYKTFEYHLPEISGKKAQVNVVTGEVKVVETSAAGEELPEVLPTVTTIADALTAQVDSPAELTGTVDEITYTWSNSSQNMSFYLTDGTNRILAYKCGTEVSLGDIITLKGKVGVYQGNNQIIDSTAEITDHDENYDEKITTITEALTAAVGTKIELSGEVTEINLDPTYTNETITSFYITDDTGVTIYVFKATGKVVEHDIVTVTGEIGVYKGVNQVAEGSTFEITGKGECKFADATCIAPKTCEICGETDGEALGHTEANAEGNCDRCGFNVNSETATLSFSDKAKRTEYTTSKQVWSDNGITLTNNKASSTTNVGDYANPARFYKNSEIIIDFPSSNVKEIVFTTPANGVENATKDQYFTWFGACLPSDIEVTNNGADTYTITNYTSNKLEMTATSGQLRIYSISIVYVPGEVTPEPELPATHTLTINPTPSDADVVLVAGENTVNEKSITVEENTTVTYTVSKNGFETVTDTITVTESKTINVSLVEIPQEEPEQPTQKTEKTVTKSFVNISDLTPQKQYKSFTLDENIVVEVISTNNSTLNNSGKYYNTSSGSWRVYSSEKGALKFTASNGAIIKTISLTFKLTDSPTVNYNDAKYTSASDATVNGTTATFEVTDGKCHFTILEVTYEI